MTELNAHSGLDQREIGIEGQKAGVELTKTAIQHKVEEGNGHFIITNSDGTLWRFRARSKDGYGNIFPPRGSPRDELSIAGDYVIPDDLVDLIPEVDKDNWGSSTKTWWHEKLNGAGYDRLQQ